MEISEKNGIVFGFMDGTFDFSPQNIFSRRELSAFISERFKTSAAPVEICEIKQAHGTDILSIKDGGDRISLGLNEFSWNAGSDGIFTDMPGIAVCVRTADCVPLLFAGNRGDGSGKIVGAVHAGWKGASGGIIKNVKNILKSDYGIGPEDIKVAVGPAICPACYEVGMDFFDTFTARNQSSLNFFTKKQENGKLFFDLKGFIKGELASNGFCHENISDTNKCNFEDASFYSFRRGDVYGRQASFAVIL